MLGRFYVGIGTGGGEGARVPQIHLFTISEIQKLADRSDMISEHPKILQNPNFCGALPRTPLGELTALPRTPSWWGGGKQLPPSQ